MAHGLGKNDVEVGLPAGQADGAGRLKLGFADTFDAAADHFRNVGAAENGKNENAGCVTVLQADRIGDNVKKNEELDEERRAADQFDIAGGEPAQRRITGTPAEGAEKPEYDTQSEGRKGDPDGVEPSLPENLAVSPHAGPVPAEGLENSETGGSQENGGEQDGDDRVDGLVAGHGEGKRGVPASSTF